MWYLKLFYYSLLQVMQSLIENLKLKVQNLKNSTTNPFKKTFLDQKIKMICIITSCAKAFINFKQLGLRYIKAQSQLHISLEWARDGFTYLQEGNAHSYRNGMLTPFLQEWNELYIPNGMRQALQKQKGPFEFQTCVHLF